MYDIFNISLIGITFWAKPENVQTLPYLCNTGLYSNYSLGYL